MSFIFKNLNLDQWANEIQKKIFFLNKAENFI